MLAEYRPRFAFGGRANFLETGRRQSVAAVLWSLSAMLAAYVDLPGPLGEGTALDLAWRYTDLGMVRMGRDGGRVVWRDGGREPLSPDLAAGLPPISGPALKLEFGAG